MEDTQATENWQDMECIDPTIDNLASYGMY